MNSVEFRRQFLSSVVDIRCQQLTSIVDFRCLKSAYKSEITNKFLNKLRNQQESLLKWWKSQRSLKLLRGQRSSTIACLTIVANLPATRTLAPNNVLTLRGYSSLFGPTGGTCFVLRRKNFDILHLGGNIPTRNVAMRMMYTCVGCPQILRRVELGNVVLNLTVTYSTCCDCVWTNKIMSLPSPT